jgi:paraquat-inducible protein B
MNTTNTDPAYTALTNNVINLQSQIMALTTKISTEQTDPQLVAFNSTFATLNATKGQGGPNWWIDGSGNHWDNGTAPTEHAQAAQYVQKCNAQIATDQASLASLQNQLTAATTAVTNYQTTSPVIAAQTAAASQSNTAIIVVISIVIFAVVGGVIYWIVKSKKTKAV